MNPKTPQQWLNEMNITVIGKLGAISKPHDLLCNVCNHKWTATPTSKIQNFKKWKSGGCPMCSDTKRASTKVGPRTKNKQKLIDRGFTIVSNWDGSTVAGTKGDPVDVTVIQTKCGHEFTSTAKNLLSRHIVCSKCNPTNMNVN